MHVLLQSEVIDVVEVKGRQVPKRTGVGVGRSAAFSVGAQNLAAGDFSIVDLAQTRSTSNEATPSPSTPHRSY
jgi:hypothetical protein